MAMTTAQRLPEGYAAIQGADGSWRWESILAPESHSAGGFTTEAEALTHCRVSNIWVRTTGVKRINWFDSTSPRRLANLYRNSKMENMVAKVALDKSDQRKVLVILFPVISILLGYIVYMHLITISTAMTGELVQSNHGFVQTTRGGFYVDGYLSIPEGRHTQIRRNRSGSERLCSIPFNEGARPACVSIIKRVGN